MNSLIHLSDLLLELEEKLENNGIKVHWAETAEQANSIAESILRKNNVRKVLKGKSMITEETHLNSYLEKHGYQVIESDLGEYIVQLAGETPAHIVAPIIHKNKQEVSQLFLEKLGKNSNTAEELGRIAREKMREDFYLATAGISGVNFAVAETGTLCLVENEGNGRFCTTLPPTHIAFMSLEKVVQRFSDIPLLYSLLCRSASGQEISVYFNLISKPRAADEYDGPKEVHLIILDNGRSKILNHELLAETLLCIRCGACMNNCPVYSSIGGHAYDAVIPGPIGKILMPQLAGMKRYGHLPSASSLCAACVDVCPVKIPITSILLKLREQYASSSDLSSLQERERFFERMLFSIWAFVFAKPLLYRAMLFLIHTFPAFVPVKARLAPFLRIWSKTRVFPKPE